VSVQAGEVTLVTLRVPPGPRWHAVDLGPFDWPAGAPLVLEVPADSAPLLVDRVEVAWQ